MWVCRRFSQCGLWYRLGNGQWPLLTETSLFAYVCVHYSQVNTFEWKQIKKISDAAEKHILALLCFANNVKNIACQFILRKQLLLLTHKQLSSKQLSMYVWKKSNCSVTDNFLNAVCTTDLAMAAVATSYRNVSICVCVCSLLASQYIWLKANKKNKWRCRKANFDITWNISLVNSFFVSNCSFSPTNNFLPNSCLCVCGKK